MRGGWVRPLPARQLPLPSCLLSSVFLSGPGKDFGQLCINKLRFMLGLAFVICSFPLPLSCPSLVHHYGPGSSQIFFRFWKRSDGLEIASDTREHVLHDITIRK